MVLSGLVLWLDPILVLVGAPVAVSSAEILGRRLGGHTGDSYGAVVVLTGTFTLLLLALAS